MAANMEIQSSLPSNLAISLTLAIIIISYLFWKWQSQRNNQTDGKKTRASISRSDMLKNRLQRFDLSPLKGADTQEAEPVDSDDKTTSEFGNLLKNEENSGSDSPETATSSSVLPTTIKPANSRKWVTLSVSNTDDKSSPETRPLTNLEELLAWNEGFDELNVSSVPLRCITREQQPRTIVCHDMKGGYVQDR